jgi:hypothetical protein
MINEVPPGDYAVVSDKRLSAPLLSRRYSKTEPPEYSLTTKLAFSLYDITQVYFILYYFKYVF